MRRGKKKGGGKAREDVRGEVNQEVELASSDYSPFDPPDVLGTNLSSRRSLQDHSATAISPRLTHSQDRTNRGPSPNPPRVEFISQRG